MSDALPADAGFLAICDELARVARYATCSQCGKDYREPPCDLADHIEGHEAVEAYDKARRP